MKSYVRSETFATPHSTLAAHATLSATCPCGHAAEIDLAALIASGRGDTPLPSLRLVCRACGSRDGRVVVSGAALAGY